MGLDAQAAQLDEATDQELQELLGQLVTAFGDQLYEYIMDKHATHVARRLLCVIVGRWVHPKERLEVGPRGQGRGPGPAPGSHEYPRTLNRVTAASEGFVIAKQDFMRHGTTRHHPAPIC
jgi:hypothetical protein